MLKRLHRLRIKAAFCSVIEQGFAFLLFTFFVFLSSCEKEITVDLPEYKDKIVVEGHIENGLPPYIVLTKSTGYFEPTDISAFEGLFVHDAVVKISGNSTTVTLEEICTASLPVSYLPFIAEYLGISVEDLSTFDFCVYTRLDNSMTGISGNTYTLTIEAEGEVLTSSTQVPALVPLDSVWFEVQQGYDSLGFAWGHLSDPDTLGNAYRWFAKRLNVQGENFIAPLGSVFDDKFIDGKSFDFAYDRGHHPNSQEEENYNDEAHMYKTGDTIVVKFCTIDRESFLFFRSLEQGAMSNSNPFGSPTPILSNISENGLGIWGGYGAVYDTIIAE